jgi:hypothetical protein
MPNKVWKRVPVTTSRMNLETQQKNDPSQEMSNGLKKAEIAYDKTLLPDWEFNQTIL